MKKFYNSNVSFGYVIIFVAKIIVGGIMNSKLLKKYIRNYLGGLSILLVLLAPIYLSVYMETKERILAQKKNQLEREISNLDNHITKMQFVAETLRSNKDVSKLVTIKGMPGAKDSIALQRAREFMADCLILGTEDVQERQYLIFRDNSIVLSANEIVSDPSYQDYSSYTPNGLDFRTFQNMLFEDNKIIQYMQHNDGENSGIICVLKGPANSLNDFDIALVFEINAKSLNQILDISKDVDTAFAYVTGINNEILFQVNYEGMPISMSEHGNRITLNGHEYSLIQVRADNCGLSWTLGISNMTISKEINNVNRIIGIYIITFGLMMLCACVFWVLRKTHLMSEIFEKLKTEEEPGMVIENEYTYFASRIEKIVKKNEAYKVKVEELSASIFHSVLEKLLLKGIHSRKEREEVLRYLDWNMEFYCVVCVNVEEIEQDDQLLDYFYKIDSALYKNFVYLSTNIARNERVYIIKLGLDDIPNTSKISEKICELAIEFHKIKVGISMVGTYLENVHLCYRQAKLMVKQVLNDSSVRVKAYQEVCDIRNKVRRLTLSNQIYDLILAGEEEGLKKVFEKIKSYAIKNVWVTEQEIMRFYFEIENPIYQAWDEIGLNNLEREMPIYHIDRQILDLINELEDAACCLCDGVIKKRESNKAVLRDEMVLFANQNFSNKEMCIGYAAENFGISDKRFSALFKEMTGENFSVYIENKRLKKAEEYLLVTDCSVNDIADAIGYNSLDAFYKSFKKKYGLAPKKWKEQKLANDEREKQKF